MVLNTLSAALKAVLDDADVRARFATQGFAAEWTALPATAQFLAQEIDKWARVVKTSGATID
ncbi:hypothetical protein D3C72_1744600 [compost metagenome]